MRETQKEIFRVKNKYLIFGGLLRKEHLFWEEMEIRLRSTVGS